MKLVKESIKNWNYEKGHSRNKGFFTNKKEEYVHCRLNLNKQKEWSELGELWNLNRQLRHLDLVVKT